MAHHKLQILSDAHRVVGMLKGLADGIEFWQETEVTGEMIARLGDALREAENLAIRVATHLPGPDDRDDEQNAGG